MQPTDDLIIIEQEIAKPPRALVSKIAFVFACLSVGLLTIIIASYYLGIFKRSREHENFAIWLARGMLISIFFGMVCSVINIIKKERLKYFKIIAAIINFVLFLVFFIAVGISLFLDWSKTK